MTATGGRPRALASVPDLPDQPAPPDVLEASDVPEASGPSGASDPPHVPDQAAPAARPLRLSLVPAGSGRTRIDGAWWPYSRDLAAELPALTEELDARWDRITRVTVNPAHWPVVPKRVPVDGHVVKVGWFTEQDPHMLMLLSYRPSRWELLVVPPGTDAATAAWLMAAAADPSRTATPSSLMDRAAAHGADHRGDRPAPFRNGGDTVR